MGASDLTRLQETLDSAVPAPLTPEELARLRTKASRGQRNYFDAADVNRLNGDWIASILSTNQAMRSDLRMVRGRSRELYRNNDYTKKFVGMVVKNVVGPNGVTMKPNVRKPRGDRDTVKNAQIAAAWKDWGSLQHCSVDGKSTWLDIQSLAARIWGQDGEILIRLARGKGKYGFQLEFLDVDQLYLDTSITTYQGGNQVQMGVEVDPSGRPVAYHLTTRHPSEMGGAKIERVPARDILHTFIPFGAKQARGLPPLHTAMKSLNMLDGYMEAELVAARMGAAKFGTIESAEGEAYDGDSEDDQGNPSISGDPGTIEALPPGYSLKLHSPEHPTAAFPAFQKAMLRSMCSGAEVSYNVLGNDLEGVNFSSMRAGAQDEREQWKVLQTWFIDHFCQVVYTAWLEMAVFSGALDLPTITGDLTPYASPIWHARRWEWVDPVKDLEASVLAVEKGLRTRTAILAEQGLDIDEVFETLAEEKKKAAALGLDFTSTTPVKALSDAAGSDEGAATGAKPKEDSNAA